MTRGEAIEKLKVFAPMLVDDTREALAMAIEALQAEPVVRCKDCQYHEWCIPKQGRSEDDYCSRGKRREP